jgi:hypothetical protein
VRVSPPRRAGSVEPMSIIIFPIFEFSDLNSISIKSIAEARGWNVKKPEVVQDHIHLFIGVPPPNLHPLPSKHSRAQRVSSCSGNIRTTGSPSDTGIFGTQATMLSRWRTSQEGRWLGMCGTRWHRLCGYPGGWRPSSPKQAGDLRQREIMKRRRCSTARDSLYSGGTTYDHY